MSEKSAINAMYEACKDALDQAQDGLWPPRDYFEHRLGTYGHAYHVKAFADVEAERASYQAALELIYRLPCGHPDNPDEDALMASDLITAQTIAREALSRGTT